MNAPATFNPEQFKLAQSEDTTKVMDYFAFSIFAPMVGGEVMTAGDAVFCVIQQTQGAQSYVLTIFPTSTLLGRQAQSARLFLQNKFERATIVLGYLKGYEFMKCTMNDLRLAKSLPFQLSGYKEDAGRQTLGVVVRFEDIKSLAMP